ncbi:MAG TPA: CHAT domain-containing protein [Chloroflexia bacterium]|nr:CHAT domain-containing protein [Chloroflexia bacterium]
MPPDHPADRYQPLHLWIGGSETAPTVGVQDPAGGLPQTPLDLTYWPSVQQWVALLRAGQTDLGTAAALGRGLFAMLFVPGLRDLYQARLGRLPAGGSMRLLLQIDLPAWAALPWELLCHDQTNTFLALDPAVSLARYIPRPLRPDPPLHSGPLRVLGVFAAPTDAPPLDLARELALMRIALAGVDPALVTFDVLMDVASAAGARPPLQPKGPATPEGLTDALAEGYDVLHYAGHAGVRPDGTGVMALEDGARRLAPFDADRLAVVARGTSLRLAVLSGCETATVTHGATTQPGSLPDPGPLADALVVAGLGAVVGMQARLPDQSAMTFGRSLYRRLAANEPLDAAVGQSRKALYAANAEADWSIPVLFVQDIGDGRLWQAPAAPRATEREAAAPGISVGHVNTGGGAVAIGGTVVDNRSSTVRHGGIDFHGAATINGPVVGGDVDHLTIGGPTPLPAVPPAPDPAADANLAAVLRPAFDALIAVIDDDTVLDHARALRAELLRSEPRWTVLNARRNELAAQPGLAEAVAVLFADPAVRSLVQAAKLRALEAE